MPNIVAQPTANPKTNQGNLKIVVFQVGRLSFALPIYTIVKIASHIPVSRSGLNSFGIAHLGDIEITIVDLYQRLFHQASTFVTTQEYLIVAQTSSQEILGIEVGTIPVILEVPYNQIRTLPASYRRLDTLEIASHVTIIPESEGNRTVFLLDVDRLLSVDTSS